MSAPLNPVQFPKGYCMLCGVTRELVHNRAGQGVCKECSDRLQEKK